MTLEQHKEHNAKYYPASVLHWLNEATDRAFKEFENDRTCGGCKHFDDGICYSNLVSLMNGGEYLLTSREFSCRKWEQR